LDHHQCQSDSICFWFRNKFPAIVLGFVSTWTWGAVSVKINGDRFFHSYSDDYSKWEWRSRLDTEHLHLIHMQMENFNDNMDKAFFKRDWNHAEVDFGFPFMYSGIHVLKDKSSMHDIQFYDPYDPDFSERNELEAAENVYLREQAAMKYLSWDEVEWDFKVSISFILSKLS
jgi:hypothetical protein